MVDRKKPKKTKKDDPEQSKRFVETARKLKVDESGKSFEKALDSLSKNQSRKNCDASSN